MKQSLLTLVGAMLAAAVVSSAAPANVRMLTQSGYLPGLPVLVRVETYAPDGSRDRETWDVNATLSASGGVTLSTNIVTLRNGMGSALVTFNGGGNFNLTATVGGVSAVRSLQTLAGTPVTKVGGILSGGSGTWSGLINVTNDVIVTNYTLTIQSNTLVMLNGVGSGTVGVDIVVNANGSIQSLGTELHPVTITCSNAFFTNRWGQILHNGSLPSLYRHTFIHRAGRAPGEGHTSQAAAIRTSGSTLTFESTTISDLCEISSAAPDYGTPAKVMFALSSVLSFNDCLFQRVRTGPEIDGTALLFTNSYVIEARGPDDSDGLYVHAQQGGQTVKITDCVFAMGDDDGIDTLGPVMSIENTIFREWNNLNEDAKGVSVFDGTTDVRHCLFTDCTVALAAKTTSSVRVNVNNSTFTGNLTNLIAAYKANAPGPNVQLRITNSVIWGGNPVHSDFEPLNSNSTNFIIRYCDIGETWTGAGNINSDPLFVNAAAKNFRVQPGSPIINAGDPASPLDVDGTRADLGYFPFLTNASPLIAFGANWRYLDNGSDQGTNWQARLFNDSLWASGPAQLGYSSNAAELDEATILSFGPEPTNKYITTYFRRAFTMLNPSEFTNLTARLLVDDGAVVYLNGQETYRINMPGGPITTGSLALAALENSLFTNSISPSFLVIGTNVLAVEVHQQLATSSDLSFDFELRGDRAITQVGPSAPVVSITAPSDGTGFITPANIDIAVSATDADGSITNVGFYQNGLLLWQTNAGPYNYLWSNVGIGSYVLTATATDNAGIRSTSSPVNVIVSAPSAAVTNTFISFNNVWKYLDNGTDAGTAWRSNSFNDTSWFAGQGQLGYGDGDEFTIVQDNPTPGYNVNDQNRYATTYFRRFFNVTNAAAYTNLAILMIRDDAGIVYLNGAEVFRSPNMPTGTVFYSTYTGGITQPDNTLDATNFAPGALLLEGTNLIAVEIHQQAASSSDISFDLQLTGIRTAETNAKPIIAITNPVDGTIYGTPASPVISAAAIDPDGTVTNVTFYFNGVKAGNDTTSPFAFTTNNLAAGSYVLQAAATDNVGQSATSSVVNIAVSTNVAPPVVFSKTPAPASVTNLASINVVFSKAIVGVNASDLLINGLPATGVSGSGSNYTFAFSPPSFGAVAITWATGHGIADTFTPSHAFDTNSSGANWNYTLLDAQPPTITTIDPVPNSTVAALSSISVTFSEPVAGVNASDLLINSLPATSLTGSGAGPYAFGFAALLPGVVNVAWTGGHGITDLSGNPFAPAPWSYIIDTNASGIVISEIMYHPSSENVLEEYIELYNKGAGQVSLNGWKFTSGISFTFSNASISAGGYLVVAANVPVFTNKYPGVTNVVGGWTGFLNNDSEDIDLDDASGNRVDSVHYADEGNWAQRQRGINDQGLGFRGWTWYAPHDGLGRSLELVNRNLANNSGQNWGASTNLQGTPGRANSIARTNTAPLILNATHFPAIPHSTDPIIISAHIVDETPSGLTVNLKYRVDSASPPAFSTLAMHDDGLIGDAVANDGIYSARLSPQANATIIEFYVEASDAQANTRTWPGAVIGSADGGVGPTGQVANALLQVDDSVYTGTAPLYKMILTTSEYTELGNMLSGAPNSDAAMNMTFISIDGAETLTRYLCSVRNRGHGSRFGTPHNYRVGFGSDEPWKGLAALNLNARQPYTQIFGSILAQKSGVEGANSRAVQIRINGGSGPGGVPIYGHYAANEDLGGIWAGDHFPEDGAGNVYKVVRDIPPPNFNYRGTLPSSYQNTYFKQSNVSEDNWTNLIAMLEVMGENQTNLFTLDRARSVINIEQWLKHIAVMNLFANGESGFNTGNNDDYFMYHGVNDPRFILLYHDLDSILGESESLASNLDIFRCTMLPISGDSEGVWRSMNWFLHQPDVEALYYRTLQDLLDTTFSQPEFNAMIDHTLSSFVPAGTISNMKTWMNARRSYVQSVITGLVPPATNYPLATITGEPRSPSPGRNATLAVGGSSITSYRYRLNGGAWSGSTGVGTPISLSNLPQGSTNTVYVVGQNSGGIYQSTNAPTISLTWIVNTNTPAVRLNEVLASNNGSVIHGGTPDVIEFYNDGTASLNLAGLRLTDDKDVPGKFTFPSTVLAAGAYLVVYANNDDGSGGIHTGFTLDPDGDQVYLFDRATNGAVVLDSVKFGKQITDLSIGRTGAGGTWVLTTPTFGSANTAQSLGSETGVKINEWLALSTTVSDFVELYNPNSLPVALGGLYLTDTPIGAPDLSRIHDLSFLGANSFTAFTADGDGGNASHANFQLPSEQGHIALLSASLKIIDSITYGPQQPDISEGKCPNGGATYATLGVPTPGAPNSCSFVPPTPVSVTLIGITNVWRYQPTGNYDAVNWMTNSFNDAAWPSGPALLGRYTAVGQILPEVINTLIETNIYQTNFYCRIHFNVPAGVTYSSLQFRHIIDDGAVFYLNGVEIPGSRFNMPAGSINGATFAATTISSATYVGPVAVATTMLVTGDNVFAVDVHQRATNSSDSAMGVELTGTIITNSPATAGVLINEVLANNSTFAEPDGSKPDWLEIYNPSTNAVDLGDMSLTDDTAVSRRWVFPAGTILNALSFAKVRCDADLPSATTNTGFGLKANGGSVYLFNRLADGGSLLSSVAYGLQAADFSIGRVPNGGSNWLLNIPTIGGNNFAATLGNPMALRVNEWMANPAAGNDDYIEIYNPNPQPVDISRFYLTDNLLNRTKHQLPPLSFLGVGQDAFQEFKADGNILSGADHLNFSLAAGGEAAGLTHSNFTAIDSISFGAQSAGVSQGRLPDGAATIMNFTTTPTPGKANFLPLTTIAINELLAHSDPPFEDAVELYNMTIDPVDISGWYLSDSQNNLLKYRIPTNTIVPPGGYAVFYENQFNGNNTVPFSFSSAKGDEVYLSQSFSAGTVTGYRAFAIFGASENGVSFGRFKTSLGYDFTAMSARTFGVDSPGTVNDFRGGNGLTNPYPKIGPAVLNEFMYNPAGISNDVLEFVEVRNVTASVLPLYDTNNPANTWRLRKGVDFNFAQGTTIPAGGYLVVVSFDPLNDPTSLTRFQSNYGTGMTLVGPYIGKLNNDGEDVELQKPDAPQTVPGPDFGLVPYVVVDRVDYKDTFPWPQTTDGSGWSLKKVNSNLYGNEALNWLGGPPTPGAVNFAVSSNSPPALSAIANRSVHAGYLVSFTASATDPDLPGQSLTFGFVGTPPTGATIGSTSGLFNWTPATNQSPANYSLTVRVTDNGAPALSDTKSFSIAVLNLPHVTSVQLSNSMVKLTWETYPGRRYRIETTPTLTSPTWTQVGSDIIASGTTESFIYSVGADLQRFYRIISYDN